MFGGSQFQVKIVNGVHHFFDGEIFADKVLAGPAKLFAQRGVAGELEQAVFQGGQIAGLNQKTGLAVETNFSRAIAIVGDDGFAGGERLRQRARQTFAQRQMHQRVHDADVAAAISAGGTRPVKMKCFSKPRVFARFSNRPRHSPSPTRRNLIFGFGGQVPARRRTNRRGP